MDKKIYLFILLVTVILSMTTVFGASFSDTNGHWAEKVVDEMASKGILNGFEDGTFKPNASVTREQFAKILVESLSLEKEDSNVNFIDIENGRWSKVYIDTASKYLTGYANNGKYYFRPTDACVREDVAVAVVMAKGLQNETPDYDLLKQFSDEDKISESLRKYIAIAVKNGIMQGKGGKFDPQGGLTRAEASQLIYNVYTKVAIGEEVGKGEISDSVILFLNSQVEKYKGIVKGSELKAFMISVNAYNAKDVYPTQLIVNDYSNSNIILVDEKYSVNGIKDRNNYQISLEYGENGIVTEININNVSTTGVNVKKEKIEWIEIKNNEEIEISLNGKTKKIKLAIYNLSISAETGECKGLAVFTNVDNQKENITIEFSKYRAKYNRDTLSYSTNATETINNIEFQIGKMIDVKTNEEYVVFAHGYGIEDKLIICNNNMKICLKLERPEGYMFSETAVFEEGETISYPIKKEYIVPIEECFNTEIIYYDLFGMEKEYGQKVYYNNSSYKKSEGEHKMAKRKITIENGVFYDRVEEIYTNFAIGQI